MDNAREVMFHVSPSAHNNSPLKLQKFAVLSFCLDNCSKSET